MILAIVGSAKPNSIVMARILVRMAISFFCPDEITSGCAPGIDTIAEEEADLNNIPFKGFPPKHRRWEPEGFKERNILIAEHCTHLFRIVNRDSKTYGSGWTHDYAAKLGKQVYCVYL